MRGSLFPTLVAVSLFGVNLLAAAPYISPRSIVNAASLTPSGMPGGSIARGSRFQVSGVGIGPAKPREDSHFPLKLALGGVTVTATAGNTTYPCWPIYVSSTLVRAILPSAVPAGPITLRITFNGQTSNPVRVDVVEHSPGLFSANGLGYGPGSVFDADDVDEASEDEHRNSLGRAHGRGRLASLVATGFGAGSLADYLPPPHQPGDSPDVDILVGGVPAQKFFVRKSFRRPGLDEVSFRVPDDAPHGCYVPVQVLVNGFASNVVTMAISGRGRDCSDDFNPASSALRDGGDLAFALLSRVVVEGPAGNVSKDQGVAAGRRLKHNDVAFDRLVALPPGGTCTVYSLAKHTQSTSGDSFGGTGLYLGSLSVANAAQETRTLPFLPPNIYEATWGVMDPAFPLRVPPPAFLDPGPITFAGTGTGKTKGVDRIGAFSVQRTLAPPPLWTNAAEVREVTRADGVRVTWSGAGGRRVFVMGTAISRRAGASAFFTCVALPGATELTVPATILGRLPAVRPEDRSGTGAIEVGAFADGTPARFSAPGLDAGFLFLTSATAQTVRFK